MQQENQWLQRVLSIDEDTPYHSNLTAVTEPSDDHSVSADEALNIGGITVFRLEKGRLTFRFFFDADSRYTAPYEALKTSKLVLRVPASGFDHSVVVTGLSGDSTTLSGIVYAEAFGENDAPLSGITIWFAGLPRGQKQLRPGGGCRRRRGNRALRRNPGTHSVIA